MTQTVLDLTQNILASMNSDAVNSITDTSESMQVAEVLKTTYFNIIARGNLPEHNILFQLTASDDDTFPTLTWRPDDIAKIDWIKYNISDNPAPEGTINPEYNYVTILPKQQFLDLLHSYNADEPNVGKFVFNEMTFYYLDDTHPSYCSIINDYYIIFDAYNKNVDSTIQTSKTLCYGRKIPVFLIKDDFVPDLDPQQFPLLLNEAKSLAFFEMKQMLHEKAEQESKRQWRTLQHSKRLVNPNEFDRLPNFGRNPGRAWR